ncbi:MAG: formylglycine-generating enzyme family protein, partial [Desulfobacterales bacterium]
MMGSPKDEPGRSDDEILHKVTLTKGFFMQTTQVTQGQWKNLMGSNPSHFKQGGDNCPVESVSWNDVQEFIAKLNQKTGQTYRLPTEAEWEYACRAGSETAFCFGDDKSQLEHYAWYDRNSGGRTHPVAQRKPNAWGLYDMHGNVWEWCADWYGYYPTDAVTDPTGSSTGPNRVRRGGSWDNAARGCRSASRGIARPGYRISILGFRVQRS